MIQRHNKKKPVFIFDIGGVVIIWPNNDPIFSYIAKRYGIPFTKMREVMISKIGALESGDISCHEFVNSSLEQFGKKLKANDNPAGLITYPFARLAKSRKGVIEFIKKLQKLGYEVDGFSNTNSIHVRFMDTKGWTRSLFDRFFASCQVGSIKPDREAYRKVMELIGVEPKDVVFVDNTLRNVAGARKAGIKHAIHFHSIEDLKRDIRRSLRDFDR
jgi:HAD superfamily hydrolase (TIGR01509 family)